jgi:hypothetical protein
MGPLAVATCATLVLTALRPGLAASLVIFSAAAGAGTYQLAVNTAFVVKVPDEWRLQTFAIVSMGVVAAQGTAFVAAGAAAEVTTPSSVIAVGGGIGAAAAIVLTVSWCRAMSPRRSRSARRTIADAVLTVAVWLLPADHWDRYRQEYRSELWDLADTGASRVGQLRYALGQLLRALPMGLALRYPRSKGGPL